MKIIKNLIVNVVICGILLYIFNHFAIGIKITTTANSVIELIGIFVILGFLFWIFNFPIKKILKILSCPVNFLTLGLFSIIINVVIFYLFQYFINTFFDGEIVVKLGQIWQTFILSFIMTLGISILQKIL